MQTERFNRSGFPAIGIFIEPTSDGTHTGLLFSVEGVPCKQEVQWHEMFRSSHLEQAAPPYVEPAMENEEINDVTGLCRLIHRRHNGVQKYRIPYAFDAKDVEIEPVSGLISFGKGFGLTCATFVLKVFDAARVPLVDTEGWPARASDADRFQRLLDLMRAGIPQFRIPPASAEHIRHVEGQLSCIRVRPEEVAGSGLIDREPTPNHSVVIPAGEWILENLAPPHAAS